MKSPFDEEGHDKVPATFAKHLFKYFNESWDAVAQKNDYVYFEKHEPLLATFALMEREVFWMNKCIENIPGGIFPDYFVKPSLSISAHVVIFKKLVKVRAAPQPSCSDELGRGDAEHDGPKIGPSDIAHKGQLQRLILDGGFGEKRYDKEKAAAFWKDSANVAKANRVVASFLGHMTAGTFDANRCLPPLGIVLAEATKQGVKLKDADEALNHVPTQSRTS